MRNKLILLLLFLTGFYTLQSQSSQQKWLKLGDATVTSKYDNESIIVSDAQAVHMIRLKASGNAIQISEIEIWYQSGEVQKTGQKMTLEKNMESAAITLKANQKLKKVIFFYKLVSGKENEEVLVELYGSK